MKKTMLSLALALGLAAWPGSADAQTITLNLNQKGVAVSPMLYGLMTEEINYAYEGGLIAQLVHDPTFRENGGGGRGRRMPQGLRFWHPTDSVTVRIAPDNRNPMNAATPTSLRVETQGVGGAVNDGFWGYPVRPSTTYKGRLWLRSDGPTVTVRLESADGATVYAESAPLSATANGWKECSFQLQTAAAAPVTKAARLAFVASGKGTFHLARPELFPPVFENSPLKVYRADLMQMLCDMKPKFLRFPGGNYLEGNMFKERFDWQKTLGPWENRAGHHCNWGYWSTDRMGLMEFLGWAEAMGAEPLLGVFAGYVLNGDVVEGPYLEPYIADALAEIEFCIGSTSTKWGAERARLGHPEPFPLHYVEIGNEDWFDRTGAYARRYTQMYNAIRAAYPQLQIISSVGPRTGMDEIMRDCKLDIVDEHYYRNSTEMFRMATMYDNISREGNKVFVGEWATREGAPTTNMQAALGDAAFMTGMERNSDLVIASCYAPLFVNCSPGAMQWTSDLIGYDPLIAYGSPSYWAQLMFNTNLGTNVVNISAEAIPDYTLPQNERDRNAGRPAATVPQLYYVATADDACIYLKMVNIAGKAQVMNVRLDGGSVKGKAEKIELSNPDNQATNSIDNPKNIVPVKSTQKVGKKFSISLKPYSITVLKMKK